MLICFFNEKKLLLDKQLLYKYLEFTQKSRVLIFVGGATAIGGANLISRYATTEHKRVKVATEMESFISLLCFLPAHSLLRLPC